MARHPLSSASLPSETSVLLWMPLYSFSYVIDRIMQFICATGACLGNINLQQKEHIPLEM